MTVPFPVPTQLFLVEHRFLDLDGARIHGARIHYVDEGAGETLLLLHGNPSWSFLNRVNRPWRPWRPVSSSLARLHARSE